MCYAVCWISRLMSSGVHSVLACDLRELSQHLVGVSGKMAEQPGVYLDIIAQPVKNGQ